MQTHSVGTYPYGLLISSESEGRSVDEFVWFPFVAATRSRKPVSKLCNNPKRGPSHSLVFAIAIAKVLGDDI